MDIVQINKEDLDEALHDLLYKYTIGDKKLYSDLFLEIKVSIKKQSDDYNDMRLEMRVNFQKITDRQDYQNGRLARNEESLEVAHKSIESLNATRLKTEGGIKIISIIYGFIITILAAVSGFFIEKVLKVIHII